MDFEINSLSGRGRKSFLRLNKPAPKLKPRLYDFSFAISKDIVKRKPPFIIHHKLQKPNYYSNIDSQYYR